MHVGALKNLKVQTTAESQCSQRYLSYYGRQVLNDFAIYVY